MKAALFFLFLLPLLLSSLVADSLKKASKPKIQFLSKDEAKIAIINDQLETYFEHLHAMEMSAKTGKQITGESLEAMRQECRKRYQNGVDVFNKKEQMAITKFVEELHPILDKHYPKLAKLKWSFLKTQNHIEGSLPHTRDKHIVLSQKITDYLLIFANDEVPEPAKLGMKDLLIHEQVHVLQRLDRNLFDSLYQETWGFLKADSIESCQWLDKHHLSNPDGVECNWVFPVKNKEETQYYLPLLLFAEGDGIKHMPLDFRKVLLPLKKEKSMPRYSLIMKSKEVPMYYDLLKVKAYRSRFPLSSNIYHPNETSADLIAKLIIFDHLMPENSMPKHQKKEMNEKFSELRTWCQKHLK